MIEAVRAAYSRTGVDWERGPVAVYGVLADALVARAPCPVPGAAVLDLGAGTGAAGRAARAAGAGTVIAVDVAEGMLRADPARSTAVVADARAVALRAGAVDLVVAAFSLNHVDDPVRGLLEARRVVRADGGVVVGAYAADDDHPAKQAVDDALTEHGWERPDWYRWMQSEAVPRLAGVDAAGQALADAGWRSVTSENVRVAFPDLGPGDLVGWRLGMAQHASFVASLTPEARRAVRATAVDRLGDEPPPLVRSIVVATGLA